MDLPSIITTTDSFAGGAGAGSEASDSGRPEKDPDAVKLFVGQVPKTFEEKDLQPYLDPFGEIHELSILRDKLNLSHKGRCEVV